MNSNKLITIGHNPVRTYYHVCIIMSYPEYIASTDKTLW